MAKVFPVFMGSRVPCALTYEQNSNPKHACKSVNLLSLFTFGTFFHFVVSQSGVM